VIDGKCKLIRFSMRLADKSVSFEAVVAVVKNLTAATKGEERPGAS